jgi:hypothetical protein
LNPSLLHGSPVSNQLDHRGQLKLSMVTSGYIHNLLKVMKMDLAGSTQ